MRSRDQLAVIEFLKENPMATARKIERCMGWSNRHTHQIVQRWQSKINPPKPVRQSKAEPTIADLCRQHWQGYSIHKIFGSGGRA